MSRGNGGRGPRGLDLKLNLSLPARGDDSSSSRILYAPADDESSPSSCLSSESEQHGGGLQWSDSPEATSMVLAACPRCFIYVMLSEADPRCPKCRSPVILDFLHGCKPTTTATIATTAIAIAAAGGTGGDDEKKGREDPRLMAN